MSLETTGDLAAILHDGHVRRVLHRSNLWLVVCELMSELLVASSCGIDVRLTQHSTGWGSWSMSLDGDTYHLRSRPAPCGERIQGIYLRDRYRDGVAPTRIVGEWHTPHDVRAWFRQWHVDALAA